MHFLLLPSVLSHTYEPGHALYAINILSTIQLACFRGYISEIIPGLPRFGTYASSRFVISPENSICNRQSYNDDYHKDSCPPGGPQRLE